MKKLWILLCAALLLLGCTQEGQYPLNLNTNFSACKNLSPGNGQTVKVILLLGQSNASGASYTEYLQKNVSPTLFEHYQQGYGNILMNFCVDDHSNSSQGEFLPVRLGQGCDKMRFGPEIGIAEALSNSFPKENIFILKYTMSACSLHYNWLKEGKRGEIYNACLVFMNQYLQTLVEHGYVPEIAAICWMQGESDTTPEKSDRYLENQTALLTYLRQDLATYAAGDGIWFLDAGINDGPTCQPSYAEVNAAKESFSNQTAQSIFFSTIDLGLTTSAEPEESPDLAHYDSFSQLMLGREFGKYLVQILSNAL